jgi:hypothetical protein
MTLLIKIQIIEIILNNQLGTLDQIVVEQWIVIVDKINKTGVLNTVFIRFNVKGIIVAIGHYFTLSV